ncbi:MULTISPECIES: cupin domain-containing protein [Desulfosediminicola]|uniref:cupin domain-containing protein n=1 Tax=Desulfosediminicola TaxID=2886823 RepID=UPI00142F1A34|nr:cupin domain-containing protein [Desulfosediminicola ganghwensis]
MNEWVEKNGYATCLQAADKTLRQEGTEVSLIRFRSGKLEHYHKYTTEFFHFTSGEGRALLDGREISIFPGTSVVVKPYQNHTFMNNSTSEFLEAVMVKTNIRPDDSYFTE